MLATVGIARMVAMSGGSFYRKGYEDSRSGGRPGQAKHCACEHPIGAVDEDGLARCMKCARDVHPPAYVPPGWRHSGGGAVPPAA